jgi:hypothetical protein
LLSTQRTSNTKTGRSLRETVPACLCYQKVRLGVAQPGSAIALGAMGREFESLHRDHGELAERFKAVVLKTIVQKCTGGSNPSLSAISR